MIGAQYVHTKNERIMEELHVSKKKQELKKQARIITQEAGRERMQMGRK